MIKNTEAIRVLLLESRQENVEMVETALYSAYLSCNISAAKNEREYRELLKTIKPEIVLSYNMPSFDSCKAFEIMNEMGLNIPVVLIIPVISEPYAIEAASKGVFGYVYKDRLPHLIVVINNALKMYKIEKELKIMEANYSHLVETTPARYFMKDSEALLSGLNKPKDTLSKNEDLESAN